MSISKKIPDPMPKEITKGHLFLLDNGYRTFKSSLHDSDRYDFIEDAICYEKNVTSDSDYVCELNDKLFIHVHSTKYKQTAEYGYGYEFEICAERHDQWWKIQQYGLCEEYIIDNLKTIEKNLITMFGLIIK